MSFQTQANPKQLEAITTTDGPLLIIAGPGSGKTFTLVERAAYLITEKGATPESLFIATFTEKAARELLTRVSNRLTALGVRLNLNEMYLGTFHSICLRWLQDYRDYTRLRHNFTLLEPFDQTYFLYQRLLDYRAIPHIDLLTGPTQSPWYISHNLLPWVNLVSEEALDPDTLSAAPEPAVRALGDLARLYRRHLADANALDFSTIQSEALTLLTDHPDVLADLRAKITHFMVDEYQDTNTIQERLLLLLTGLTPGPLVLDHNPAPVIPSAARNLPNLAVVGDDDQGLYRFRGATIRNILQFTDHFPPGACTQVTLTTNYRSHRDIITFYNRWMSDQEWTCAGPTGSQTFRHAKQIAPPADATFPPIPAVVQLIPPDEDTWHAEILTALHALRDQGHLTDWNQVAFLFRSVKNDRVAALSAYLEEHGIPVYAPRANQFFEREEVRLLLGALIFLFPQFPQVRQWKADAHLDIWDYYDEHCFRPFAAALRRPENFDLLRWARARAADHAALIGNTDYNFTGLFYQLLQFPLFSRYLDEDALRQEFVTRRPLYNIALLSRLLNRFDYLHHINILTPAYLDKNLRDLFNQYLNYLKEGGIDEYEDDTEYAPSGCVSFLTIHQSKGQEYPVVIVGSLHTVPRKDHTPLDELLQEHYYSRPPYEPWERIKEYDFRRLYYTAFSRAQNWLILTDAERRTPKGTLTIPSKYFQPYVAPLPSWRAADLAALPLARLREVDLKREYSFTGHIALFENCAEQYRFFRELEFAPVRTQGVLFGTLVHQTLEDIHRAVLRGETAALSEDRVHTWFDANYAVLTQTEHTYLAPAQRQAALNHILRYYRRYQGDWSHLRDAEVDVSLVKDAYILTGTVDLIVNEHGDVSLVDFKSDRLKPDYANPDDRARLDRYRRQLDVYAHLVEERLGVPVAQTRLYYTAETSGLPYHYWDKDTRAIDTTMQAFDAIVERIEAKDFAIPARPGKLCEGCDMRHYCDHKNWRFRAPQEALR